jgi:hypothetical protein
MQMLCPYYALIREFIYISCLKVYNLTINIRAIKVLIASHMIRVYPNIYFIYLNNKD